ncbi:hypothetical protein [Acinetobacter baumannii]|uniref:hypothetical protein n=1 Tax=Acinetobacter baumannii TaxID=470 RepID=UPI00366D738C
MADFKIQVKLKKDIIRFRFETLRTPRGRVHIQIVDEIDRSTKITFDKVKTYIPSTLLSRWVNFHMKDKLLSLAGKGSSVEYVSKDGNNNWQYRDNVQYFGLHDIVKRDGKVVRVTIDDSIGMKKVIDIINAIGYDVLVDYDPVKGRMNSIVLEEKSYA